MHNFRKLQIWGDAMVLAKDVYTLLKDVPGEERFGLVSQLRRCAVSVPSNIAEGSARTSDKEFAHFLRIALGSCYEMETQIILAHDFGYIQQTQYDDIINKIIIQQKRITKFINTLS